MAIGALVEKPRNGQHLSSIPPVAACATGHLSHVIISPRIGGRWSSRGGAFPSFARPAPPAGVVGPTAAAGEDRLAELAGQAKCCAAFERASLTALPIPS